MSVLPDPLVGAGRRAIHGAPEGQDARLIALLARTRPERPVLHVALNDARLAHLAEALAFFDPEIEQLALPAWDCLPYDRVSPNAQLVGRRIDTLTRLAGAAPAANSVVGRPRVVLTTVNAATQRVPPRAVFADAVLDVRPGARQPVERLIQFLNRNGYQRTDTVREPGEYAVRGGILDVFPSGAEEPLRLDYFGDVVEGLRGFDALTQISTGKRDGMVFKPMSEAFLDEASVQRFRAGYRLAFGAETLGDPLYEAVSAARRFIGMEHWLPLFHEGMETLFDYLPGALVTLDHQGEATVAERFEQVAEVYAARRSIGERGRDLDAEAVYKPLPPERLYLMEADWAAALARHQVAPFSPYAPPDDDPSRYDAGGRPGGEFAAQRTAGSGNVFDALRDALGTLRNGKRRVLIGAFSAGARDRLVQIMRDHDIPQVEAAPGWAAAQALPVGALAVVVLGLERGFVADDLAVIGEQDILGQRLARPARRRQRGEAFMAEMANLAEGDLVVHVEHGIGRYDGLVTLDVAGAPHDCLRIIYAEDAKLFVPVENIDVLGRFGAEDAEARLDRLGATHWQARRARVKQRVREIAQELIRLAAERQLKEGETLVPVEGQYDEFCARFPWSETEDQQRAIEDTIGDLAAGRPTDRLVCGDVGFGKTEVALRAAFVAAMSGTQVAMIVPTTLLCRQHYLSFVERFAGFPVRIGQLSRLQTAKEQAEVRKALAEGRVDVVVGTHALLGKSISFTHLGLLIVDEEQHFGVAQKERLKQLKTDVHVLTLTATPIPRTLQMALSGVREMSVIATPPVDRLSVRTFVLPYDGMVVREAILRERHRGGQIFYVCPRIEDIDKVAEGLRKLVPEIGFEIAHGRMASTVLEGVMTRFLERRFDLLLSTQIVESGLDIPSANTIIIHRADMFGLAQLYQLRGRVGRAKTRAYAYLTVPPNKVLTQAAEKRLQVMQTLDQLGAGFQLASHDLDIRGAGNLLGDEQSGHIREVGVELYQQMLAEAVAEASGGGATALPAEAWTPQISLGTPVLIPETYVADLNVRLGLYRRVAGLVDRAEIDAFAAELIDRFGPLPVEVSNLIDVIALKKLCRDANVEKVDAGPKGAVLSFRGDAPRKPERLIDYVGRARGRLKLRPDHKLVWVAELESAAKRLTAVTRLMRDLAKLAT